MGKSDHSILLISCKISLSSNHSPQGYAFSKGDYIGLRNSFQSVEWEKLLLAYTDNTEDMWQVFKTEILDRIDTFIPKINTAFNILKKDSLIRPLPLNVRAIISKKHRLWTRHMETRDVAVYKNTSLLGMQLQAK